MTTSGPGATVIGDSQLNNTGAIPIDVTETISPELLIRRVSDAIRGAGIAVSNAGTQLALPTASSVVLQPDPAISPSALTLTGTPGVNAGNVSILLLPTDSAGTIANRISNAVQAANDANDLPRVSALPNGRSLNILGGGFVVNATGNLVAGGVQLDGIVQGIELVNNELYAVTDAGELYQVSTAELNANGNRTVGRYVATSTDLIGINFSGLRAGPVSVEGGALSQILFGITGSGDIYAFNTRGELQPIFAGGRSRISTGIGGALGLDFSVVDFNLWHVTGQRGDDPGHGINPLFNDTRLGTPGSSSLAFTYENAVSADNYPSIVERPTFTPRQDGVVFEDTYNVPGGAKGAVQSNPFSLEGYAADDLPMLYFNYFMETEATPGRDALRVYVVTSDGVEHLVATNNSALRPGTGDDEFDDPDPIANPAYADPDDPTRPDDIDTDVQLLFDTTNSVNDSWRQARVPLSEFAGRSGLSLRIEFSTSGTTLTTSQAMRAISGQALVEASNREFTIDGSSGQETFVIDLAPTVAFPSGLQLADLYSDDTQTAVITIDGQEYLLNDGTRVPDTGQINIDLLAGTLPGTTLESLSASAIATAVANQIQGNLGSNPVITDFNFSDPMDDPNIAVGRNDLIYEATPLPYTGGNLTITGTGRLGTIEDPAQPPTNLDDVDLVRLEVTRGALIEVDVDLDFNTALNAAIRFFDADGNEVTGIANPANDTIQYTATIDGLIYIGISGLGNETYDPRIDGSAQVGQIDSYSASVSVTLPSAFRADGNLVEFVGGQQSIMATPPELFTITQRTNSTTAVPVPVSRFMSATQVADEVQRAIANRYTLGDTTPIPTDGPSVRLPGFNIVDSGPFGNESDRYGNGGGFRAAPDQNAFEGVYLDDFIIGFAERGEIATGSNQLSALDPTDPNDPNDPNAQFISDGSRLLTNPPQPTQPTTRGAYQLEIRDGSEYVNSSLVLVDAPELQFFAGDPVVVPISGVPFGIPALSIPVTSIISADQSPFPAFDLPTVDINLNGQGEPIVFTNGQNLFVSLATDGTLVQLIELDSNLEPVPSTFAATPAEARFRTFDTNDRLANGFTLETLSGTSIVDGATFSIFDSLNQLSFEFDVADSLGVFNGLTDPAAIVIEVTPESSAAEIASQVISILNSQSVQAALDVKATRANTTTPPTSFDARDFIDTRINIYGNISFREVTPAFATVTPFDQRGDTNRERDQQGVIIIENSRFLFNSDSGISITRDAEARVLSGDQRDEFPVALTYPANLLELNTEGLIPGVVVQNNVLAYNANNGILVRGIDGGGGALNNPVGFDQIINNTLIGGVVQEGVDLGSQIFSGFLFQRGGISFADEVDRDTLDLGSDVDSAFTDTEAALSSPDFVGQGVEPIDGEFTLSLGTGGQATFRFTDNFLTGNDSPTPDLVIFEAGASESVRVEISRDGESFRFVGNASGLDNTIDIDQFGYDSSDRFAFVRLTDLVTPLDAPTDAFGAAGADIDAVGALSTVPATQFTPGAQGIFVTQNAGPTLLNNIVANFQTGLAVTPPSNNPVLNDIDVSQDRTVIGGITYFRNAFDANGTDEQALGLAAQIISDFEQIFVDPATLIFTPQHGVRTIDSSIDSLEDRASLRTVRTAVGLSPVPIIAPTFDLNGQLRVDDPQVDTPTGVGQSVFKDRGAEDRADEVGPRLSLINPRADDLLIDSGRAFTVGTVFDSFDIQLIDGITPADPGAGVGVDDGGVNGSLIRVTRLEAGSSVTESLVEGIDYRFAYEPADNRIRLTPIAGIWKDNSTYTVEFLGNEVGILQGQAATEYADGALTEVDLTVADRRSIEVDTGIGVSLSPAALTIDQGFGLVANIEGQSLEVFDGHSAEAAIFVLTTDNDNIPIILDAGNIPVRVGEAATPDQIAAAVAIAINDSSVKLFATAVGSRIQLRDSVVKATELFQVKGAAAYLGADVSLSRELRGVNIVGQSLTVFDGTSELTFVLATDPSQVTDGNSGHRVTDGPHRRDRGCDQSPDRRVRAAGFGDGRRRRARNCEGSPIVSIRKRHSPLPPPVRSPVTRSTTSFKITNYSLDVVLSDQLARGVDGASITIFDGEDEWTFEFDNLPPVAGNRPCCRATWRCRSVPIRRPAN